MKNFVVILIIVLSTVVAGAQPPQIDSLKNELRKTQNDTLKLVLSSLLCFAYQGISFDSTLVYSQRQFDLAKQLNYPLEQAYALDNIGYNMYNLSNPNALQTLLEGLKIAENPRIENEILPEKYWDMEVFYDPKALPTEKRTPRNVRLQILASINQDIGHIYGIDFGDLRKQLDYFFRAVKVAELGPENYSLILNYNTIADTYLHLHQLDSALLYGQKALNLAIANDLGQVSVHTLAIISNVYFQKKNYDQAKDYAERAITVGKKYYDYSVKPIVQACLSLSNIYFVTGPPDSSFFYAKQAYEEAKQANSPEFTLYASDTLVRLYTAANNRDSAFKYLQSSYALKNKVYNSEKIKRIQGLDFEAKERQKEIEASKKKFQSRLRTYLLLGGLVALLVIAAILLRSNRLKQRAFMLLQKQKNETDKQRAKAEDTLTELRSTQAQLIQSEKMASLGELTAGIAHEIQNPLNFVNNFSEVSSELLDEMKDELATGNGEQAKAIADDIKENLAKIIHHGKRADGIVKGMLMHSRASTGQKEATDINVLADEYLRLSYHGLRAKDKTFQAKFETHFDKTIEKISVLPQDIGRVLLNLFTNAFYSVTKKNKHHPEDYQPCVSVTTKRLKDKVEIRVRDNGMGIPQKVMDKIFQPFFTTKPTGEGTGLGLSLSYDIITKGHGGELKVETKEGEFAEFIILLPIT